MFSYSMNDRGDFLEEVSSKQIDMENLKGKLWQIGTNSKKCSCTRARQKGSGLKPDLLYIRFHKPTPLFFPLQWMPRCVPELQRANHNQRASLTPGRSSSARCPCSVPSPGKCHTPLLPALGILRHSMPPCPWLILQVLLSASSTGETKPPSTKAGAREIKFVLPSSN